MDKNLFAAVALSILVYIGWFSVMNRFYPQTAAAPAPAAAPAATPAAAPARVVPAAAPPARPGPSNRAPEAAAPADSLNGALRYHAGRIELRVQPFGASIASFLYPGPREIVELVPRGGPGFFAAWPEVEFSPEPAAPSKERDVLPAFVGRHPCGAILRKEFLIDEKDNLHSVRLSVSNPGRGPISLPPWDLSIGPGLGTIPSEDAENPSLWRSLAAQPPPQGRKQLVLSESGPKDENRRIDGPFRWAGVDNRYFLAAAAPPPGIFDGCLLGPAPLGSLGAPSARLSGRGIALAPGQSVSIVIPAYLGPKGYTHLRRLGLGLEKSVQFGWFDDHLKLGRLALKVLYRLQRLTGNYGWSIILMTILLQAVLFPLTYKQMKSTQVMKRLQPELTRIQQRYAKDPQRLNREMLELYRKHGANPLGGCLPLLLQMPIFVALFNALRNAWELHGAGWIFWIRDLSSKDPFYVLPLVMGGVMFLQSRMNPVQMADQAQAKMFQYMPVIFTFMFLNFPAGLVLYWLTNSILGVCTQMFLKRHFESTGGPA